MFKQKEIENRLGKFELKSDTFEWSNSKYLAHFITLKKPIPPLTKASNGKKKDQSKGRGQ